MWFGAQDGRPGMLVSLHALPELPKGVVASARRTTSR
jgi:hypothetical protein